MKVVATATFGAGHLHPVLGITDELRRMDHSVTLVVPRTLAPLAPADYAVVLTDDPPPAEVARIREAIVRAPAHEAAILGNRELFGRLSTSAMLPRVLDATDGADLVVHDAAEYAGPIAAVRRGLTHVQVAISQAAVEWGSLALAEPAIEAHLPGIADRLRAAAYFSRFPASLDPSGYPDTRRYHAPRRDADPLPDWWGGSDAPLVYVTLGSAVAPLAGASEAFATVLAAATSLPARVLVTTGHAQLPDMRLPSHVHVEPWVSHDRVLAAADLVVCHGGSGTVLDALGAGVPLVVVPMFADQPANARLVLEAGAGVSVGTRGFGRDRARDIAAAVSDVLGDGGYRGSAQRVRTEMEAAPTAAEVLTHL